VPLTVEGQEFFKNQIIGKLGGDFIFTHKDGKPWKSGQQGCYMVAASEQANITPLANFKALRNSYGAFLANAGATLQVIAKLLGHGDTRITEKHYAHLLDNYVADTLRASLPSFNDGAETQSNIVAIQNKTK